MLSKVMSSTLSMGRQSIQPATSNWMGRSLVSLCNDCDPTCPNLMKVKKSGEAIEAVNKRRNELCVPQGSKLDPKRVNYSNTTHETFGEALLPKNIFNPLYPFQKGLLKPNSMLHPHHPIWDDSSSRLSESATPAHVDDSSSSGCNSGSDDSD